MITIVKQDWEKQIYFDWVHWLVYCLFITAFININKVKAQTAKRESVTDYRSYTYNFMLCPNVLALTGLLVFISKSDVSDCFGKF